MADAASVSDLAVTDAVPRAARPGGGVRPARRGGRLFTAFCAALSLAGAGVALIAPTLRPQAQELARQWLGEESPVLRYFAAPAGAADQAAAGGSAVSVLAPLTYTPPVFRAPQAPPGDTSMQAAALAAVRAEMIATLRLELDGVRRAMAEQGERLKSAGSAAQAAQSEAASARVAAESAARVQADARNAQEAASRSQDATARAVDGMRERLDRVETQVAAFDARLRATGLVASAGQLRRDIDAGAPLREDLLTTASSGPLPAPVQRALEQLSRSERGVPTLRDLGVSFDALEADILAHGGGQGSWLSLSGWIGGPNPQRETLDRLRALAAEGRFSEVADMLERSDWADLAQHWVAQVRLRSATVMAGQTVMAHALEAYEASQAAPGAWPPVSPPTGPGRVSP